MKKLFAPHSALLMLCLLFTGLLHAHTSQPVEVTCPIDGEKFTINVTMSYTSFGFKTDFEKEGAIGDLYPSSVNSCPKCHYSGYRDDFDTTFTKETISDIEKILEPFKTEKMNDVLENEIAVKIYQYFKRDNKEIANLYLVASYLIRYNSAQIEKRKTIQRNCASYFEKAIQNKEYDKKDAYATIEYLIGEMYRRSGDFENAVKYYDLALNDPDKKEWVTEYATKQKELAIRKDDDNNI